MGRIFAHVRQNVTCLYRSTTQRRLPHYSGRFIRQSVQLRVIRPFSADWSETHLLRIASDQQDRQVWMIERGDAAEKKHNLSIGHRVTGGEALIPWSSASARRTRGARVRSRRTLGLARRNIDFLRGVLPTSPRSVPRWCFQPQLGNIAVVVYRSRCIPVCCTV